jgi:5-methylcytosine-specific restriction endonuclease McrA
MPYKDPLVRRHKHQEYMKNRYNTDATYRENHIKRVSAKRLEQKEKLRSVMFNYLRTHPCVDCGESDIVVLDFDHVKGKKTKGISTLVSNAVSVDVLMSEIEKCVVRCSNCHRRKTAKSFRWHRLNSR